MKIANLLVIASILVVNMQCNSQNKKNMEENKNPLLCKPENGVCEIATSKSNTTTSESKKDIHKAVKIIYYTDPICSSCWGIEPQLRKLKLEYGNLIDIEYRMGGLLKDWTYNSGGISKPSDVAHHWDEVSHYYDMPIDGDVWLEDPLMSSYPPSIAFKAAELQDKEKSVLFLREIREMVFLKKVNITKWENLEKAAKKVGLNMKQFKQDYEGKAKETFIEDLNNGGKLGVRGFPTLFFTDSLGKYEIVYGAMPYTSFENALLKFQPNAKKVTYDKSWNFVFSKYNSLTAKEYSELTGTEPKQSEEMLNELTTKGKLETFTTKNGSIWTLKKTE